MSDFFDEGMIAPVSAGEKGKELGSCSLCGGLSIVRTEDKFDNIYRLPWLPPCQ